MKNKTFCVFPCVSQKKAVPLQRHFMVYNKLDTNRIR